MRPGQTVNNFIRNGRGSLLIDGSLVSHYGIQGALDERNVLAVKVKLNKYIRCAVDPRTIMTA